MKSQFRSLHVVPALALAVILGGCQTALKPQWDLPPSVKALPANGYPMAYAERGTGPAVLFVHAALNDYRSFAPQMEPLSSRFRVVSVSLRHYYPEPWKGDGEFSLKLHGEDLGAFIERLGAGPVVLVGWSRGGAVALETARLRPELVRKLVLMDPGLFQLLPAPSGGVKEDPRIRRAKAAEAYFRRGELEAGMESLMDDINGKGFWARLSEEQRQLRRDNAWTVVGQLGDEEKADCADISQLKMPVLVMEGEKSPQAFKKINKIIRECLPPARSVTIAKASHPMHQDNPADFNEALAKFAAE